MLTNKLLMTVSILSSSILVGSIFTGCNSTTNSTTSSSINSSNSEQLKGYTFNDTSLPMDVRVEDLVNRLTLDEKIAQMFDKSPAIERLGIAEYKWWNEALHGVARAGKATVFPQAIGLAATFNEELIFDVATAISDEGRAKHHAFLAEGNRAMYTGLTYWSPNINIFRDPRWGRGQETYGEDPFLTARIATNFVNGLQGSDDKYLKSVATIKHFAVHSGPEFSRHSDDYHVSKKDMKETYLPAFAETIENTNVESIMCAYNRVNGEPACGSEELLKGYLRDEFKFKGYVVSDCGAIADFYDVNSHHIVKTPAQAAAKAVLSGTDLNCGNHHGNVYDALKSAVTLGLIDEETINKSVKRLFLARFKLGMFDPVEEVPFSTLSLDKVASVEHLALAQKTAEQSLVLLKNDGILPLNKSTTVAIIGPNADNTTMLLGNYHGKPTNPITPKNAITQMIGANNVNYAVGSSITGEVFTHHEAITSDSFYHVDFEGKTQPGLHAKYYPSANFEIQPTVTRIDENIDFRFVKSPVDGKNSEDFSVKWHGLLVPKHTANYEFKAKNVSFTLNGKDVNGSIKLEANTKYVFEAKSTIANYWHSNVIEPQIQLSWLNKDQDIAIAAIAAAKKSDVIIFIGGITAALEGEEMPLKIDGFSHGDRTHIKLPASQLTLIKQLAKTGKPIVYVNLSGSAIALNWIDKNASAVVQGFYPGELTGTALTRLLFGEYSPSGRLPVTFYRSVDDLPDFKDYTMDNRTYKYYKGEVLYPFGFGLSYADINYQNLTSSLTSKNQLTLSAIVTNASSFVADEVVQVYLSMPDAPVKTPIRQLVSFKHITIPAKGNQELSIVIPAKKLTYVDNEGNLQLYTGRLEVSLGSGQGIKLDSNKVLKTNITI